MNIVKSEYDENGKTLQEVIEQFLIEYYYEFYELKLIETL